MRHKTTLRVLHCCLQHGPAASRHEYRTICTFNVSFHAVPSPAGKAAVKAEYDASSLRALSATPLALADAARVSVLHSSLQECLLRLAHERYSLLAQWPDFTKLYGADYYYRAHPEDLRKFYALVDEFHRMWDVVTEFDSLSGLAQQLVPAARRKRLNVIHPAVGPTSANGAVAAFLLAHAK